MKRAGVMIVLVLILSCFSVCAVYSQGCQDPRKEEAGVKTKAVDVDNDGKAEVTYHCDGKQVTKAQADTNDDGKPDITVNVKDGKFQSAHADIDHDQNPDKTFNDLQSFDKWINETHPDYDRTLNRGDWSMESVGF
ncbi:MAG: hypothetical protein WC486_04745 [Candidatus Omnitrophota bacterium]